MTLSEAEDRTSAWAVGMGPIATLTASCERTKLLAGVMSVALVVN